MNESSSGFGDESPILCKHPKLFEEPPNLNLEELYKDLLQYLKKTKTISRNDLKSYLEQVTTMNPYSPRRQWLVQKLRGLLKFILKRKAAFQDCVVKGEIIIYEKSTLGGKSSVASTPLYASSSVLDFPASMLSNNNFETMDTNNQKSSYNYSQDLFSGAAESLHNFGQENYQIFRELTNHGENENNLFKMPVPVDTKIEKVYEMHDNLEEKYNSLVSLTSSLPVVGAPMDESLELDNEEDQMKLASNTDEHLDATIFDNEELVKEDFERESEEMEKYIQKIVVNLLRLEVKELRSSPKLRDSKNNTMLNDSTGSTGSTWLRTYHSVENFKIIRETCAKFRENLANKGFDFLQDLSLN